MVKLVDFLVSRESGDHEFLKVEATWVRQRDLGMKTTLVVRAILYLQNYQPILLVHLHKERTIAAKFLVSLS